MRALIIGLGLAGVAAALHAQKGGVKKEPPPVDTVHLRFAWPVGLNAAVTGQRFKARLQEGKADTTNVRLSYQMSVEPHAKGRVVRFHHFAVPGVPEVEELEERISALMPSLIVDTTGEFVGIVDVDAMRRELDAVLGPASKHPLVERFRSTEVLTALAANEWNALVGTWIGGDLELGETYFAEFELPFPLYPGVTLPVVQEFTALDRVPCIAGETERRCIELESTVYPDEEAFAALIARMMGEVVPDSIDVSMNDWALETTIHLIAEPGTLVPYLLEVSKRVSMKMQGSSGRQEEIKTTRFEYPARRP